VLPIALKIMLGVMDAVTVTWYRFLIASVLLFSILIHRKRISGFERLRGKKIGLFLLATVGLAGNYVVYLLGLRHLTPSTAQVVLQLAPMFLLFSGVFVFRERFHPLQWAGFAVFFLGLGLFFNQRLEEIVLYRTTYSLGVALLVGSALLWAMYAMVQKQLLKTFSSEFIMLLLYAASALLLLPRVHPSALFRLDATHLFILAFCGLNTLIAYGSFAEALDHWEASRVSAVLTLIPLITVVATKVASGWWPHLVAPEHLNTLSLLGALFVVTGSMFCALRKPTASP
jgi:drug/metabolite transporter (DMT)-like permease